MYKYVPRACLLVAGMMLVVSIGCQTEVQRSSPGALPSNTRTDINPRLNASTYFAHGHLLERQGNYKQAIEQYRRALELSPKFLSARNRLGIALNKLGSHAQASTEFRRAIEQKPTQAYLHNNLGFSLYLEHRYEQAVETLRHALELKPDYSRARMNYGVVLAKLGQYDQALSEFTLAAGKTEAYYNLGIIQTELGEYAAAARSLETALSMNPRFEAARRQLHAVARLTAEAEALARRETVVVQDDSEQREPAECDAAPRIAGQSQSNQTATARKAPVPKMTATEARAAVMARLAAYPELMKTIPPRGAGPAKENTSKGGADSVRTLCNLIHEMVTAADGKRKADYERIKNELKQHLATAGMTSPKKQCQHNPSQNDRGIGRGRLRGSRAGARTVQAYVGGHTNRAPEPGRSPNAGETHPGTSGPEERGAPRPGRRPAGTTKHTRGSRAQ